jgi:hypothetical protein
MVPVIGEVRAYFGPVDRTTGTPTQFDAVKDGAFELDTPPNGWVSLGTVSGFKRTSGTKYAPVRTGTQQQVEVQVRNDADATVEFAFFEWGKLQLALASGTSQFNILAGAAISVTAVAADAVQIGAADAATLHPGDWVVVDADWSGQAGFVGAGAAGAYVSPAAELDADFIRRVSMNVAQVLRVSVGQVQLNAALLAGRPTAGMKLQKLVGFADREGASFFQEWSGLFVADAASGGRVCFYYPRLQSAMTTSESVHALTESLGQVSIPARLRALPVLDAVDGESVLCYRMFLPGVAASAS